MNPLVFKYASTVWGMAMLAFFLWTYQDAPEAGMVVIGFWTLFVIAAIGTFADSRVAWIVCILQLLVAWVMMGMLVSDSSFDVLVGMRPVDDAGSINVIIMNSFLGIVLPSTMLMVLAILSRQHLVWVFTHRRLPRIRHSRKSRPKRRRRHRRLGS